jgi:hypothetical protein
LPVPVPSIYSVCVAILALSEFLETSGRVSTTESGYEEGLTRGARYVYPSISPTVG